MLRNKSFLFFSAITLGLSLFLTSQVSAAPQTKRLGGNDRYQTCSKIVNEGWESSGYAVIVNGDNFPDALSASTLAKKYNAPILLTQSSKLDSNASSQLKRLGVKKAFIVGGNFVVKPSVENKLHTMGIDTERFSGGDRTETSVAVAKEIGTSNGIIITTDNNFTDALSIASIAAKLQMPIVLVPKDSIPSSVSNLIKDKNIKRTYVLGDSNLISDAVVSDFPNVQRISGTDKYERNINIINTFSDKVNFSNIYFAYSEEFADALSGAAIAALNGNPVILVGDSISNVTRDFVKNKINLVNQITILGGNVAIKDGELNTIFDDNNNKVTKQDSNASSFDINISINYKITLDDKVKGVNPNIIRATRQAIFDVDCYVARLQHYNGYSKNNDVLIFDIKEKGTDTWEVDFKQKEAGTKEYDTIGYSYATVEKQKSGSYIGYISHSSVIIMPDETL